MGQNETKRDGNKKIHIGEYSCALVGKREEGGEVVGSTGLEPVTSCV